MISLLREFGGDVWAMEGGAFESLRGLVERIDLRSLDATEGLHARIGAAREAAAVAPLYSVADGVARIDVQGTLFKSTPWLLRLMGVQVAATEDLSRAFRAAAADAEVRSILLAVDSPGGAVAGVADLADEIHRIAQHKPVITAAQDAMNSGAYWLGAQGSHVFANRTAAVGSIGAFAVLTDSSEAAAKAGVKVHVIRSGPLKGASVPGAAISDAQLAAYQDFADQSGAAFVGAVARGRRRPEAQIAEHATGGFWSAPEAAARGLIDGIASLAEAHDFARAAGARHAPSAPVRAQGRTTMDKNADPAAPSAVDQQELVRLRAEVDEHKRLRAAAEAEAQLRAAALAEMKAGQIAGAIERGVADGRITPPMRSAVEAFATSPAGDDPAKLAAFIAQLPVQTRTTPVGSSNDGAGAKVPPAGADLSASDRAICKAFGLSPESFARANSPDLRGTTFDRRAIVADGRREPLAAFLKIPAELRAAWSGSVGTSQDDPIR